MDLGDPEAAEADRIPSPITVAVSRRGPDSGLTRKVLPTFCDIFRLFCSTHVYSCFFVSTHVDPSIFQES